MNSASGGSSDKEYRIREWMRIRIGQEDMNDEFTIGDLARQACGHFEDFVVDERTGVLHVPEIYWAVSLEVFDCMLD